MNDELIREIIIGQKPLKNTNELLLKKEIIRLNEEIEELKAEIEELNDDNVWWTNRFKAVKKEHIDTITRNEEYRARIDKAIEEIGLTDEDLELYNNYDVNGIELYKILKGE